MKNYSNESIVKFRLIPQFISTRHVLIESCIKDTVFAICKLQKVTVYDRQFIRIYDDWNHILNGTKILKYEFAKFHPIAN